METAAWVQAFATIVLVLVTLSYVLETRRTALREQANRKRDAVVQAAQRALNALSDPSLDETTAERVPTETSRWLSHALDAEEPFIDDAELQSRMRACSGVASACLTELQVAFRPGQLTGGPGESFLSRAGQVLVRRVVKATRASLQANLTEKPLPAWSGLPSPTSYLAWVVDEATSLGEG